MELQYDVLIVGAGISGINAAHRVQSQLPKCSYAILEATEEMGGTWALFKYPGIRSDSDLFTFGFSWRPWTGPTRFAKGDQIASYIKVCAHEQGIDKHIQYGQKVTQLSWDSAEAFWTVSTMSKGRESVITAKFVILGTGYYNYNEPLKSKIAGIENFQGQVVHPQFWPEDLDYKDKRVVIIGSGATAVTLLPNMAKAASHVTMLQRSPSYVMTLPNQAKKLPLWVPHWIRYGVEYLRYLILPFIFFKFCRTFPNLARKLIRKATTKELSNTLSHDPHFNPTYNPWEQRLCVSPDGDFFESIRSGKATVITDTIKDMKARSICLSSGKTLEADIIVSATGLKLQMAGGAKIVVDGKTIKISDKFIWRGIMLEDVPNCAFVIGYTNASWTLGADCTAIVVCRLLQQMKNRGSEFVVPSTKGYSNLVPQSILNLNSTYITTHANELPKAADVGPWKARVNYFRDFYTAKYQDLSAGIRFE